MGDNRIHWSTDGTLAYFWLSQLMSRTALSAADKQIIDSQPYQETNAGVWADGIILGFPKNIKIEFIRVCHTGGTSNFAKDVWVSTDSTNGLDGTWTQIVTNVSYTAYQYTELTASSVINCRWLRIKHHAMPAENTYARSVHIFGEYQSPRFEFWDAAGSAELTAEYPLSLDDAENGSTYTDYVAFKLKNTDSASHDYSLSVVPLKYGGDSIVSNYIKLSTDSGSNKSTTVTISGLAAGNLSGEIRLYGDLTAVQNPGDGLHQFAVDCTETA